MLRQVPEFQEHWPRAIFTPPKGSRADRSWVDRKPFYSLFVYVRVCPNVFQTLNHTVTPLTNSMEEYSFLWVWHCLSPSQATDQSGQEVKEERISHQRCPILTLFLSTPLPSCILAYFLLFWSFLKKKVHESVETWPGAWAPVIRTEVGCLSITFEQRTGPDKIQRLKGGHLYIQDYQACPPVYKFCYLDQKTAAECKKHDVASQMEG